jgi:hypothetical protein
MRRYQLSVLPEHGSGALARNARTRCPAPAALPWRPLDTVVEVHDLAEYDACVEVARTAMARFPFLALPRLLELSD